jgi:dTMP kinase
VDGEGNLIDKSKKGFIVSFEGIDASGKTTQSKLLRNELLNLKLDVEYLSFPDYSTVIGDEIHDFLSGKKDYPIEARHMLYSANRYEHKDQIDAWLSKGKIVIINRYCESNIAYGVASGLSHEWLLSLESLMPKSDYVLLIKISPELSLSRKQKRDKFELDLVFLQRVCQAYAALAKGSNWFSIEGNRSPGEVRNEISKLVTAIIKERNML